MKMKWIHYITLSLLAVCMACSDKEELLPESTAFPMSFKLSVAAEGDGTTGMENTTPNLTRLYLVERRAGEQEKLYCDTYYDIEGNHLKIDQLLGQWYKFVFFRVPAINDAMGDKLFEQEMIGPERYEFYDRKLDYTPLLDYQQNLNTVGDHDLAIYRKIVDRWVNADMPTQENILMQRITGQLVMQMGKPADQFDTKTKGPVTQISLKVDALTQCYQRDKGDGEVIPVDNATKSYTFTWTVSAEEQLVKQEFPVMLLPGTLQGEVTVTFTNGVIETYPLQGRVSGGSEVNDITIHPNRRTIVLFNGINKEEFEIRYAGFADGNDANIDVDTDEWDGIQ